MKVAIRLVIAVFCGWLVVLCWVNPNHFTSPDSVVYLRMATMPAAWDSTFPIGYPSLIAFVAALTGLPVLWASKLVNGLSILVFSWLWQRRVGQTTTAWLASIWLLGQFLRIAAYTWSETVFLVLLAEWVWQLHRLLRTPTSYIKTHKPYIIHPTSYIRKPTSYIIHPTSFIGIGLVLFLVRYVGGFIWIVVGILLINPFRNWLLARDFSQQITPNTNSTYAKILLLGITGCGSYLVSNQLLTGSPFGGPRFLPTESVGALIGLFGRALLNECLLIRDVVNGQQAGLVWAGVGVQLLWMAGGLLAVRPSQKQPMRDQLQETSNRETTSLLRLFLLTGTVYLFVVLGIRTVSPFNGPDARTMAPFTFCYLIAFVLWLSQNPIRQRAVRSYWLGLILCSWAQLWPQSLRLNQRPGQSQHSITSKSPERAEMRTKPSWAASLLLPVR